MLALLFPDSSTMFLDVVTNYSKARSSNVSTHPVDASSVIADHVSKQNPNFSIRAIVSAADFHTTYTRPGNLLEPEEEGAPRIGDAYNNPVSGAVLTSPSQLLDYLPSSIQNIIGGQDTSSVSLDPFRGYSHQVARDRLQDAWDNSELVTILDYDYDIQTGRSVSVRSIQNCIMTRFEDVEQVETGDSMVANLSFQQVRFAYLKEVDVQISQQVPSGGVSDEASGEDNYGDQTSTGERLSTSRYGEDVDEVTQAGIDAALQTGKEAWKGFVNSFGGSF